MCGRARASITSRRVLDHGVGDHRMALGGRMHRAAVERRIGRLQDVVGRNALAVGVGGEERVVRRADQPPVVAVGQRIGRIERLELVGRRRLARHAHVDAVHHRGARIAGADAALGELDLMLGHQREAGAAAGRKPGRAVLAVAAAGDALQAVDEIVEERRRLGEPFLAQLELGMHVHADRRLAAAQLAVLVVLDRLVGVLDDAGGSTPKPSCSASLTAFIRLSSTPR